MKRRAPAFAFACAFSALFAAGSAHAGRSCESKPLRADEVQRSLTLAANTAQALDAGGARVVVLARAGQDLSRHGLAWSHLGLAYRDAAGWRVAHKLNACGSSTAALYRQGLAEFFLDGLHEYKAGVMPLAPAVQAKLLPVLRDNRRLASLHTPAYSMVAYPWAQRYQQSNQWAIETLAMAQDEAVGSRERAQNWLERRGYEPTTLHIDALTRLGARVGSAHIAFDDHPNAKRFTGRIDTVTVDSVFAWLNRSGLGGPLRVVQ